MVNKLTIQHKRSSVAGNVPAAGVLKPGEIGINFADKAIYTEDGAGNVIDIGSKWTNQTSGISRSDRVAIGHSNDPLVAVDVFGSIGVSIGSGSAIDASFAQVWNVDTTANPSVTITGTVPASTTLVLKLTGGGSVTWPASIAWPGGTAPTLSTGTDVISLFTSDNGTTWIGNYFALDAQ